MRTGGDDTFGRRIDVRAMPAYSLARDESFGLDGAIHTRKNLSALAAF